MRLDDLYPGWDGLDAGSTAVPIILQEFRWRSWDWSTHELKGWFELDPGRPVVVEGVGAISRASRPLADVAAWVELDDATRKERALRRDGDAYAPHWDRWAEQESRFIHREKPRTLCTVEVSGYDLPAALEQVLTACGLTA